MTSLKDLDSLTELWAKESDAGPASFIRSHMDKFNGQAELLGRMVDYFYNEALTFNITEISSDDYAHFRIEEIEAATLPEFIAASADHYDARLAPERASTLIWRLPNYGPCGEMLHLYNDVYAPKQADEVIAEDEFVGIFEAAAQIVNENFKRSDYEMHSENETDDPAFTPKPGDTIIDLRKIMTDGFDTIDEKFNQHSQALEKIKNQMRAIEERISSEILATNHFHFSKKPMGSTLLNTDYRGVASNSLQSNAIPHADSYPVALAYWNGSSTIMLDNSQFEHIPALKLYLPKTNEPIEGKSLPREHFALIAQGALHKAPGEGLKRLIKPSHTNDRFVSIAGLKRSVPEPNSAL